MGVDDANSYSTHAFRRGASMALQSSGANLTQVLKTIGWNSATFRDYLSFVEDEEVDILSILANFDEFGSSGDESAHDSSSSDTSDETSAGAPADDKPVLSLLPLSSGAISTGLISTWRRLMKHIATHWVLAILNSRFFAILGVINPIIARYLAHVA